MATFIKAVLPSGRGVCLEKLTTKQYRTVAERVATRVPDNATGMFLTQKLGYEMLLASLRGITAAPIDVVNDEKGEPDVDAMLASVPETAWIKPTFEDLIIAGGARSLEVLLEDPSDYLTAEMLATSETLGGGSAQAGAFRGKVKREFAER